MSRQLPATHATPQMSSPQLESARCYLSALLDTVSRIRRRDLFCGRPVAQSIVRERGGVSVIANRTTELSSGQLSDLLRYRLAKYLCSGFADPQVAHRNLYGEPVSLVGRGRYSYYCRVDRIRRNIVLQRIGCGSGSPG